MKRFSELISIALIGVLFTQCSDKIVQYPELRLWYQQPAVDWNAALPVGNGRLGAMIYGNPFIEQIQVNEESLWAGSQVNSNNPNALKNLKAIQQELLDGKLQEAFKLATDNMIGIPPRIRSYQTMGDIFIDYGVKDTTNYIRQLDLNTGVHTTTFTSNGVEYTEKIFASAPDNVIVINVKANKKASLSPKIKLRRDKDVTIKAIKDELVMEGQIIDQADSTSGPGGAHMKFAAKLKVLSKKGNITAEQDSILSVSNADEVTLLFTAATDYNLSQLNFDRSINPSAVCDAIITHIKKTNYLSLYKKHEKEYGYIYHRVSLTLGNKINKPTDKRLEAVKNGAEDSDLVALYFQYGRYLLMSSSRYPGALPANLQGIWNKEYVAPWNSDFHTNINLQMNYWPAEVTNLSETVLPLSQFFSYLQKTGSITARETYGARGWTLHHVTDPFGRTAVMDGIWGAYPMGGPWMTFSFYEHYAFTGDKTYLKEIAYPLMKSSAQFVLDFLIKDKEGQWVTAPSNSPENRFYDPKTGLETNMTYAAAMDIEIINELFKNCIHSAKALNIDEAFRDTLKNVMANLPPVKVSPTTGGIQEWIEDYKEVWPGHRHMSHLLGLYPGTMITPIAPKLFQGAKTTIEKRLSAGGGHTGWSRAWIINFYARLLDAEKAHEHVNALLNKSTLSNLFDNHPPFQIDGNFGGTSGIAEMLIQSHAGYIQLLPALPKEWSKGSYTGLKARGNFEIGCSWTDSKLTNATIKSVKGNHCSILYTLPFIVKKGNSKVLEAVKTDIAGTTYYEAEFPTQKDEEFVITLN